MGKQEKYQDDRDVFEKVLDDVKPYAGAVGGAYLGGRLGSRLFRGMSKNALKKLGEDVDAARQHANRKGATAADERKARALDKADERAWMDAYYGGLTGGVGGGVVGVYGGYLSRSDTQKKLRRKK